MSDEYTTVCDECKQTIEETDSSYSNWNYTKSLCEGCWEEDVQYASTLFYIYLDKVQRVSFGNHVAIGEDGESPQWFNDLLVDDAETLRRYVHTDGWRGYYDSAKNFKGLASISSGWTTGWVDDTVSRKQEFNEWVEELLGGNGFSPFKLYVLVEPTSNVFSTAVEVLTPEENLEPVKHWIAEQFDIDRALS